MGIDLASMGRNQEAETHFRRAIQFQPNEAQTYYFYGRWLFDQGRLPEAAENAKKAIALNPVYMDPRHLLMSTYARQGQSAALKELAQDTLNMAPGDPGTLSIVNGPANSAAQLAALAAQTDAQPSPERYLNLSLMYNQAGKYQESIDAARKALRLNPNYADAYNNIAAAYEAMSMWDPAIEAAQQALRIKPDYQLAKNNLAWSISQKNLQHQKH